MRLYLAPHERRPDPEPLRTDDRKAVLVGTVIWILLLLAAVATQEALVASGRGWWLWTAAAGAALGLLGLAYLHHREVQQRRGARPGDGGSPGGRTVREPSPPPRGR